MQSKTKYQTRLQHKIRKEGEMKKMQEEVMGKK